MAKVYRALHTGTHRRVALKIVHPQLAARKKIVEKFLDEARMAGKIPPHPNIVQVFDSGRDDKTTSPFIAMELVEGKLLDEHMADVALPWCEVKLLLGQLADALGEAHTHKIVHRDLKPNNLIVSQARDGSPLLKVLDFGIAKVLGDGAAATSTQIGTPVFCAPEQLGATMRKVAALRGFTIDVGVSPATDVWAFALLAYQMLTGYPPGQYWQVDEMSALIAKIALEDRTPASETAGGRALHLPHGFDEWFLRCLQHSAAKRYQEIGKAMKALAALLDHDPAIAAQDAQERTGRGTQSSTLRMAVPRISEGGRRAPPGESEPSNTDDLPPVPAKAVPVALPQQLRGPQLSSAAQKQPMAKTEEQAPVPLPGHDLPPGTGQSPESPLPAAVRDHEQPPLSGEPEKREQHEYEGEGTEVLEEMPSEVRALLYDTGYPDHAAPAAGPQQPHSPSGMHPPQLFHAGASGPYPAISLQIPEPPQSQGPNTWKPAPEVCTTGDIPPHAATSGHWPSAGPTPYAAWLSRRPPPESMRQVAIAAAAFTAFMLLAIVLALAFNSSDAEVLQAVPLLAEPPTLQTAPATGGATAKRRQSSPVKGNAAGSATASASTAASAAPQVSASAETTATPASSSGYRRFEHDPVWGWH